MQVVGDKANREIRKGCYVHQLLRGNWPNLTYVAHRKGQRDVGMQYNLRKPIWKQILVL